MADDLKTIEALIDGKLPWSGDCIAQGIPLTVQPANGLSRKADSFP